MEVSSRVESEKELGAEGIDNYLETKCVNIFTGESTGKWYKG